MGKQIPIDNLFRDRLSNAEEQLNLGAWANMERMLDGKNPYAEEETKRKRRILPFLLFFTLVSGLLTAGYYKMSHRTDNNLATNETVKSAPVASNQAATTSIENKIEQNNAQIKTENNKNATDNSNNNKNNNTNIALASTTISDNEKPLKSKTKHQFTKVSKTENDKEENNKSIEEPTPINKSDIAKLENNSTIIQDGNATNTIDNKKSLVKINDKKLAKKQKETTSSIQEKEYEKVTTTKKEQIKQIEVVQNVKQHRNGNIDISFDTIAISKKEIEKEHTELVAIEKSNTKEKTNLNPRYKQLTKEEEAKMTELNQLPLLATTNEKIETPVKMKDEGKKSDDLGFFGKLREFANNSYQKMTAAAITALDLNVPAYTGISLGVNAAVFNQKNNFGGFHIGVSNIKPINETFSILTELKFFLKNNSGYTIKDISTQNKPVSVDNITLANQNQSIYTYQMDSTVSGYNFKSFTSLEMPIMFQTHIGTSVIAYGGVNMAYNFRLNIKEVKTNYVVNKKETLDNSLPFYPVAELGKKYARDDFGSRFGLGYTIGASYSFNPNIYLDLRLTKNVWDNAKLNAAKEIAGSYFTIPTVQFSLGYRFRKFDPKR